LHAATPTIAPARVKLRILICSEWNWFIIYYKKLILLKVKLNISINYDI
jgi:hypothetical protein